MKTLLTTAAAATLLLAATVSSPAIAADARDFTLHNGLGSPISHVYVSEANNDKWEADVLGTGVLGDGDSTKITFSGYADTVCKFDIKITEDNDKSWIVSDVDLCEMNAIKFSKDGDKVVFSKE